MGAHSHDRSLAGVSSIDDVGTTIDVGVDAGAVASVDMYNFYIYLFCLIQRQIHRTAKLDTAFCFNSYRQGTFGAIN